MTRVAWRGNRLTSVTQPVTCRKMPGAQLCGSAIWIRKRCTYGAEAANTSKFGASALPTPSIVTRVLIKSQ